MFHRLPTIFCDHCGRGVPRAALHCLWCQTRSPLRALRTPTPANRYGRLEAEQSGPQPPAKRRVGES